MLRVLAGCPLGGSQPQAQTAGPGANPCALPARVSLRSLFLFAPPGARLAQRAPPAAVPGTVPAPSFMPFGPSAGPSASRLLIHWRPGWVAGGRFCLVAGRFLLLFFSAFAGGVLVSVSVALASVALPASSVPSAPAAPAAPAPVAAASAVVASAVSAAAALGGGLLSVALRPSLPARGAVPSGRWVLAFSFSSRPVAVAFAQLWGGRLGLFLRVLGGPRAGFSVSVPLLAGPASGVGASFSVALSGAGAPAAFSRALRGLSV